MKTPGVCTVAIMVGCALFFVSGCVTQNKPKDDSPLTSKLPSVNTAIVNGIPITNEALMREYNIQLKRLQGTGTEPSVLRKQALIESVRQRMITEEVLFQKAKLEGYGATSTEITAERSRALAKFGNEQSLSKALEEAGYVENSYMQFLDRQITIQKYVNSLVANVQVSDEKLLDLYNKNRQGFLRDEIMKIEIANVPITGEPSSEPSLAAHTKAEAVEQALRAGKSLDEIKNELNVQVFTLFVTRNSGKLPNTLVQAAFALKPGETSGVLETPGVLHVIRAVEVRPPGIAEFDEVRESILEAERRKEVVKYLDDQDKKLRESATIQLFPLPPLPEKTANN